MKKESQQNQEDSRREAHEEESHGGYGEGPFSRPLPRPTGCWAGCIRTPCCLTNRVDRRNDKGSSGLG